MVNGFDDLSAAARTRDVIERIVKGVIRNERPEVRVAKVYSYDVFTNTAQVLYPGDDITNLVRVAVPANLAPSKLLKDNLTTGASDVVRIAGKPGNLWIDSYIFGIPFPRTQSQPYAPEGGRRGLAGWYAALGNRDIAAAKVVLFGDSITEGTGATNYLTTQHKKLEALLRARYTVSGVSGTGMGYLAATTAFAPGSLGVIVDGATGGHSSHTTQNDGGFGMKTLGLHGNNTLNSGATITFGPYMSDRVRVWATQADAFAQDGKVKLDGGADVLAVGTNTPFRGGQIVYDSGALTRTNHTLLVRGDGTFDFNVEGVEFFDQDFNKGVHVYDGAHFGFNTNNFVGTGPDRSMWKAFETLKPQLTIINLGTNDIGVGIYAGFTPEQTLSNIDTMLANIATKMTGLDYSVLLVIPYRPSNTQTSPKWDTIRYGLISRESDKVSILDLNASWPVLAADGSRNKGLMLEATDPLHPSNAGHDYIASLYYKAISIN